MAPKERRVWWVWISVLCAGTVARAAEQGQASKDPGESGHLGGTASYFTWTAERRERNATWVATNTATSAEGGPTTPNTTVLIPVQDTTGHKTTGQLSKPAIAIHSGEGICNVTLNCTMRERGGDITYVWHQPGTSHILATEPVLRITQKPADGFLNYTCTIRSAESKNSSTVSLSEHCHGQAQYSHPQLRASASSSLKYWVPLAFMVIVLITLYFTYRKTTERESRSRAGSIDQSSEDSQDNQEAHSAAHIIPHPEVWNQTDEETLQAKETLSTEKNEAALSDPDPSPSQIEQSTAADSAAPPSYPRMPDPGRPSWPLSATPTHGETTEALVTFEESSVHQSHSAPNLPLVPC
ncbi:sorting nexin-29 [Platysternon megacephalum]|uniref:Sorting nexin-29 n=1 Tax=Platysternon megacephalum TaxID=55544 RepID=A0A4D9E935_9SAUR|nr:sorting nexin-29 [Platysternon megacephalum]